MSSLSRAPLNILHAERMELQQDRGKAWQRLDSLTRGDKFNGAVPDDHPSVVNAREQLEKVDAEIARVQKRIEAIQAVSLPKRAVVDEIERYISRQIGSQAVEPFTGKVEARIGKGSDVENAIARTRGEVEQLRADLWAIEDAPVPSAVSKARAREQIEVAAKAGEPNVWGLIESSTGQLRWPSAQPAYVPAPGGGVVPLPLGHDGLAFALWVHKSAVIEAVERRIDELSDDSIALSDEERTERRAAVAADLLQLEREEEALVLMAQGKGLTIHRRPDCDPRAILNLDGTAPEPRRRRN